MTDSNDNMKRVRNLWAPWRMEYIESLGDDEKDLGDCFLCYHRDHPDEDDENLVLFRGKNCFSMLNRFPYTGGHAMVAPYAHVGDLSDLKSETMLEIMEHVRDLKEILANAIGAQGFNVGINIGRAAGAGLPGHLHVHLVPRWSGDTNFMSVFDDVRVVPTSLQRLHEQIRETGAKMDLLQRKNASRS